MPLPFAARAIPLLAAVVTALAVSATVHAHPSTDTPQAGDNRVTSEDPRRQSARLPRLRAARASLKPTHKTCAREHSLGGDRAPGGGTANHIYGDAERLRTRECQRREAPPFTRGSPIIWPSGRIDAQPATTYNNAYTYDPPRPHAPSKIGAQTLKYDPSGNQTSSSGTFEVGREVTWDDLDQISTETDSSFTNTYIYNSDGQRTHKRRTTLETVYVNQFYVIRNLFFQTKHIYAGPTRVASTTVTLSDFKNKTTTQTPVLFYYHTDHLGSTGYLTDRTGQILEHEEYLPSGEAWFEELRNASTVNRLPWKFNGKELDETGLYYYGARYYNPRAGVWMSPDPVLSQYMSGGINQGAYHPLNLGLYSYAWNNPIILRDQNGAWPSLSDVGDFALGVRDRAVGLAIGVGQAVVPGAFLLDLSPHVWEGETREFLEGKALGQSVVGAVETGVGLGAAALGSGGEVVTLGAATPVAVPVAVAGAGIATNGVGNILMAKRTLDKAKGAPRAGASGGERAGKSFTRAGKAEVKGENAAAHAGQTTCTDCGQQTVPGQQSRAGVTPPGNETHVDHIIPKSKDGNGSPDNGQVLCRTCNLRKGAN